MSWICLRRKWTHGRTNIYFKSVWPAKTILVRNNVNDSYMTVLENPQDPIFVSIVLQVSSNSTPSCTRHFPKRKDGWRFCFQFLFYSWLPITWTLANLNRSRFPLDFLHTFTVILLSVTGNLDNSNLPLTRVSLQIVSI